MVQLAPKSLILIVSSCIGIFEAIKERGGRTWPTMVYELLQSPLLSLGHHYQGTSVTYKLPDTQGGREGLQMPLAVDFSQIQLVAIANYDKFMQTYPRKLLVVT